MNLQDIRGFSLTNINKINVVLGKNGCGKSHLLKQLEQGLKAGQAHIAKVRYISPERGGVLQYEPSIDQAISQNLEWIDNNRRKNQSDNFRAQSATLFRRLELLVLREIEQESQKKDFKPRSFETAIEALNKLLDRVRLKRDDRRAFAIIDRETLHEAAPADISSGEAELISLGIEFLSFAKECIPGKENFLLVDEPDVHLHPDLQDRLAGFMADVIKDAPFTLILATHSTALLAGLAARDNTHVAFMRRKDTTLTFKPVSDTDRAILPIFGAHPLSNVFNQSPILLLEGEDDERMWQQAVRSGKGKVRVFPCVVDGLPNFSDFETEVNNILESVYDNALGYSLRDKDQQPELIEDVGRIVRMRLGCRAAENLMLSDEVLALAGIDWPAVQKRIGEWAVANGGHQYHSEVKAFIDGGFDRKDFDLKTIRNILIGLFSNKPWEVLVGQAIAALPRSGGPAKAGSLRDFLGDKLCKSVLRIS